MARTELPTVACVRTSLMSTWGLDESDLHSSCVSITDRGDHIHITWGGGLVRHFLDIDGDLAVMARSTFWDLRRAFMAEHGFLIEDHHDGMRCWIRADF